MDSKLEYSELGLTLNESKVYETILQLKKSGASEISKNSGVPYGRIYTVLESVEQKNLIKCLSGVKKQYIAVDPENLRILIDTKIKKLMEIDTQVKELKKIYTEQGEENITVIKGKKNLHKTSEKASKPKIYSYIIIDKYEKDIKELRKFKDLIRNKTEIKILGRIDTETKEDYKNMRVITKDIKPIKNEGTRVEIIDDIEVIIQLTSSNTAAIIRDKAFAKVMKQLFIKYYANTDYEEE
jgi:sugar-specific transcriptional regulator TrmB